MKTKEELEKEIKDYQMEIESLKEDLVEKQRELDYALDVVEDEQGENECLREELAEFEKGVTLDTPNLMELQKAELLVKAQKKFSLQELEDMFGGNSFDL